MKIHVYFKETSEFVDDYDIDEKDIEKFSDASYAFDWFRNDIERFGCYETIFKVTDENGNSILD